MIIDKNMVRRVEGEIRKLNASKKIKFGQICKPPEKTGPGRFGQHCGGGFKNRLGRFQADFGGPRLNRVS